MGKLVAALVVIFFVELAMGIYLQDNIVTSLTSFLTNIVDGSAANFYSSLVGNLAGIAAITGIVAGFLYAVRPEAVYGAMALTMVTFFSILARWWAIIGAQPIFGGSGRLIASIIIAPLVVFFFFAAMDYPRQPA